MVFTELMGTKRCVEQNKLAACVAGTGDLYSGRVTELLEKVNVDQNG